MKISTRMCALACAVTVLGFGLAGCGNGSSDTVTVEGDVPIAYVKRSTAMRMNPTDGTSSADGGDLMVRELSSSSAPEHNVTAGFTQGKGDASDPEVSYDGKKIVFAMRCAAANDTSATGIPNACTGRWNIWEYDMSAGKLSAGTFRRITSSTDSDDVDPAYLPAGRGFVFSSNRQTKTKTVKNGQTFFALDEYERERVLNLHTMDADGGNITQISVNQSHDRNPVVRPDGFIMFSRWEHVGMRNRFAVFTVKPDGTEMFVFYGAHSGGNSFLHPRDMDPKGKFAGYLTSDLMSLSGTQEGGALMLVDAANYSEQNTPIKKSTPASGGQVQVTQQALNDGRGLSEFGRVTTPYPLWDGTDRVLASFRPCEVTRNGNVVPCSTLTADEKAELGDMERTREQAASAAVKDNAPASYAVYMYSTAKQNWLIVAAPPQGYMYTDPVALLARDEPKTLQPAALDGYQASLAAANKAVLEVRSIYDTDGLNRMGEQVLTAADLPAGCAAGIAKTTSHEEGDTRAQVADIASIKDPSKAAYLCAPGRFIRASRAVAPQAGMTGMREAIGETDFEPQQILGYAPIEPDGSFKLEVPADTPLALTVIDAKGRGLQTHLNWIQVRPGERRTCDGCHSPRRGGSLNSGAIANTLPAALKDPRTGVATPASAAHLSGETLASLRTRLVASALQLQSDMVFTDVWADTTQSGVVARAPITIRYTGNADAADDLQTPAPVNGMINYKEHIQPIWTRARGTNGANTCSTCHADTAKLDLSGTTAGTGRVVSYEELVLGDPQFDANTGLPVIRLRDGVPEIVRDAALVNTDAGDAGGMARSSRLAEILYGENLKVAQAVRDKHPNPPGTAPDHSTLLNLAERRLVTEWMDLGGQYYNDLSALGSNVLPSRLSETAFRTTVMPILQGTCAACHQPSGSAGAAQATLTIQRNRFVLTGSPEGDFNVTVSLVSNTCDAPNNALLRRPSNTPASVPAHPVTAGGLAYLPAGGADYQKIATWIAGGCP
jgi:hypothetical protein